MPKSIKLALIIIWIDLALGALVILLDRLTGTASVGAFSFAILLTALSTIIPYKIANKSNGARYFWTILNIFAYLLLIGLPKVGDEGKYSLIVSYITSPAIIFSIYLLFVRESNEWFKKLVEP